MLKNFILKSDAFKILTLFLIWKIALIGVLLFSIRFIPLGYNDRFLGGGPINYHLAPYLFSWANFDGEHYLSIAIFGYKRLEQAFFPLYPILISFFSKPFSYDLLSSLVFSTIWGLFISNISFFIALLVLYKLLLLDFSKKIAFLTIIILLLFPTSFYFGALYNESLFLLLSVTSFYLARKKRYFLSSIFGFFSSATRIFGILLLPTFLFEVYRKEKFIKWFWGLLIPIGLISYMIYQYWIFGDPLAFYNLQTVVGEQHQKGIILLPQVYFRYIKMLLSVDPQNPIYQTLILEFLVGIIFFILPVIGYFRKVRLSYLFYAMVGFLLPTIQGSFSSVPRYVIVFFPSFIVLALIFDKFNLFFKAIAFLIFTFWLFLETALFLRGYWVA